MTTLGQKLKSLPAPRRAAVKLRAKELVAQEMTLREARQELTDKTQAGVADKLGIGQDSVSRLEQRGDMLVSTLRDYVGALGGRVRVLVELDGLPAIELKDIGVKRRRAKGLARAKRARAA